MRSNKLGQISIFIVLFILIIFLFVFLFSFQSDKTDRIINQGVAETSTLSYDFNSLEEQMDACLDNALKRSIIISSFRGGLLYDQNGLKESYVPAPLAQTYRENVLEPFDIDENQVFLYTDEFGVGFHAIPKYDNIIASTNSLVIPGYENQFRSFILDYFFNCVDLNSYKEAGFEIDFKEAVTSVKNKINSSSLALNFIEGSQGDALILEGPQLYEEGFLSLENGDLIFRSNKNIFLAPEDFSSYQVINKELSISLDLNFDEEFISTSLFFPVVIGNTGSYISTLESTSKEEMRFLKIRNAALRLIQEKLDDRTLDYTQVSNLTYALAGSFDNFNFKRDALIDEVDHKKYVYTIEDTQTQFLGEDLRFQFAYENFAPELDFSYLHNGRSLCYTSEGNICSYLFTPNSGISIDLSDYTRFIEQRDIPNIVYSSPDVGDTTRYSFSISDSGVISFEGYLEGNYLFEIQVSDGETTETYFFRFLSGTVENLNNEDANSCIIVYNTIQSDLETYYPINSHFINEFNTLKLFEGVDSSGKNLPFFYTLQQPKVFRDSSIYNALYSSTAIRVSETCVTDSNLYKILWTTDEGTSFISNDLGILTEVNDRLTISPDGINSEIIDPYTLSAQIVDVSYDLVNGGATFGEAFKIRVYPTRCLGPGDDPNMLGGFSCCNEQIVIDHSEIADIDDREEFANLYTDSFKQSEDFSDDYYFSLDLQKEGLEAVVGDVFDFSQDVIWEASNYGLDSTSTSLYKGNVGGICNMYPRWQHNINQITPSRGTVGVKNFGKTQKINFINSEVEVPYSNSGNGVFEDFDLKLGFDAKSTQTCEFGLIDEQVFRIDFKNNGVTFKLIAGNSFYDHGGGLKLGPIPDNGDFNDVRVLCENKWYGLHGSFDENIQAWSSSPLAYDNQDIHRSKAFCSIGAIDCGLMDTSIGYPTSYEGGDCTKTRFDGTSIYRQTEPALKQSGWQFYQPRHCIDISTGAFVGTIGILKNQKCNDWNPVTVNYQCQEFRYDGDCLANSRPNRPLPVSSC